MINTFDFSSYLKGTKLAADNVKMQVIQENQADLKEQRERLLKGLLDHLNNETDSIE